VQQSATIALAFACACTLAAMPLVGQPARDSPYLLLFAGDQDKADSDFLAVIDLQPDSETFGKAIATQPIGMTESMPHHMEYQLPPDGELLFMNAHHHEMSFLVDVSNPRAPRIAKTFSPPAPLRFPHDYSRTPSGTRLVGFLRSEGRSPDPEDPLLPGNQGGIAEYSATGDLLRTVSAAVPGARKPVRPYAFAFLPDIDRFVVTSAWMMERSWADVVQIYRYSDFTLLETMDLPPGRLPNGRLVEGSQTAGFGPRVLADGSVFFNSFGCAFYRLTDIDSESPRLDPVFTLDAPPRGDERLPGSCGIPVVFDDYWLMPVGKLNAVVVLDIGDPATPREVFRMSLGESFTPHWLARDPRSNRLVLGAELGGEEGFYLLRFDAGDGDLSFDIALNDEGRAGYLSLVDQPWPHGATGPAWGHAALFLPD
jgi:hypothetical protein